MFTMTYPPRSRGLKTPRVASSSLAPEANQRFWRIFLSLWGVVVASCQVIAGGDIARPHGVIGLHALQYAH